MAYQALKEEQADVTVEILPFDMPAMTSNGKCPTIAVFGARGSGKSVLIKDILYHYHLASVPRVCVFSATEGLNSYFAQFVPGMYIHSPVSVAGVTRVFEEQKNLVKKQQLGLIDKDVDLRLIIVLDDLAYSKQMLKSEVLAELALNGRHSLCILVISIQYLMSLPIQCRSNIDFAFISADDNLDNVKRIANQFASGYDFTIFKKVFAACTKNYETFVLPHKKDHDEPEKNSFFYKAQFDLKFKFGSPEAWDFHDEKFISELDEFKAKLEAQKERKKALPKSDSKAKRTKQTIMPKTKRRDQIIHVVKG